MCIKHLVRHQLSVNSAFFFSTNAVIPILRSLVAKVEWKRRFSKREPRREEREGGGEKEEGREGGREGT